MPWLTVYCNTSLKYQNWASSGMMLPASAHYQPSAGHYGTLSHWLIYIKQRIILFDEVDTWCHAGRCDIIGYYDTRSSQWCGLRYPGKLRHFLFKCDYAWISICAVTYSKIHITFCSVMFCHFGGLLDRKLIDY